MNPQDKRIYNSAIEIGERIKRKAIYEGRGVFWKTKTNEFGIWRLTESTSIYGGISGIILFFLDLYQMTKNKEYLGYAEKGGNRILDTLNTQEKHFHGSFFTGSLGVIYTLFMISKVSGNNKFGREAKKILQHMGRYDGRVDDLLNGSAGVIIGLLHLHKITQLKSLLEEIEFYLKKILDNTYLSRNGLYWDRSDKIIHGLCGISHGASGMGYTFLLVGKYFKNPAYFKVAQEAFTYENNHFSKDINSWPDFRKMIFTEFTAKLFRDNWEKRNFKFFHKAEDFTAWCHGAGGIALSRLLAFQYLKIDAYAADLQIAIRKVTTSNNHPSYTICHGYGGDLLLFLELYNSTKNRIYLEKAYQITFLIINIREQNHSFTDGFANSGPEEDLSLFNGLAGIGYCLTSILRLSKFFNVLNPKVVGESDFKELDKSTYPHICMSLASIKKVILNSYIPQTNKNAKLNPQFYNRVHLNSNIFGDLRNLDTTDEYSIKLEIAKMKLEMSVSSWAFISYKNKMDRNTVNSILQEDSKLQYPYFILGNHVQLLKSRRKDTKGNSFVIIFLNMSSFRADHLEISKFEFDVLRCFQKPELINTVYEKITKKYNSKTDTLDQLNQIFTKCIRNALAALFLDVHSE